MHSFSDLVEQFELRFSAALPFSAAPANLYDPCRYMIQLGGKRVRPILCLMAAELFGDITGDAWHAAFGIELFHNFTLIHDDILDNSPLRRGKPTLFSKYGLTCGILCGDVMCVAAYEQLGRIAHSLSQVLAVFTQTAKEVCEGQQLDMDYEHRRDVTMDEYLHMITLKTSVLLAASLKMGAHTGGALGDNANKLYALGKNMGIAFQLMDDYLDAFGDPVKSGKQVGGDIRCNKKTFLLLKAIENADIFQRKEIDDVMGQGGEDKVYKMISLFVKTGADIACLDAANHYSNIAFQCLDDVAVPSKRKGPLSELANYLLNRDK